MNRIIVDTERCEGHGQCAEAAPAVLILDDEGVATALIDSVPNELVGQAEAGVRVCPVAALRLVTSP